MRKDTSLIFTALMAEDDHDTTDEAEPDDGSKNIIIGFLDAICKCANQPCGFGHRLDMVQGGGGDLHI
jgi:hypothetical protein